MPERTVYIGCNRDAVEKKDGQLNKLFRCHKDGWFVLSVGDESNTLHVIFFDRRKVTEKEIKALWLRRKLEST